MSSVWLARHRSLANRQVAIKLLLTQDDDFIQRFQREAALTSNLRHPNIVQIYDYGFHAPYYYTIMEYVAGGALRQLLEPHQPLPLDLALHIFRCAGAALDYAHAQGVIHRDVSPGNILVEQGSGRVLLTDFGIAREAGKPSATTISKVMGTPGYLSPEHASSATAVTHLSDLYGLGIVLFEMLSGQLPWEHSPGLPPDQNGGSFESPRTLRDLGVRSVPEDVDRIIGTMLALDVSKRYPSAQAAIQDLDRVLARHNSVTQVVSPGAASAPAGGGAVGPLVVGNPHPVETALGVDLLKAPIAAAEQRAAALSDPRVITQILNDWSGASWFRRPLLGRLANIRQVDHFNVYFYTLHVLYETREPVKTIEEPDREAVSLPLERELDRWGVELPAPKGFADDRGGTIRLPGSTRVTACSQCKGVGKMICPRCKGAGRVQRPAVNQAAATPAATPSQPNPAGAPAAKQEPELMPCPACRGAGGLNCARCEGVGRLLERKVTTWRRQAQVFTAHDDLPEVDEHWLRRTCALTDVYCEQQLKGVRPEWLSVPPLRALVEQAQAQTNNDTQIALSEVRIAFIPITEIAFDLGEHARPDGDPDAPGPDMHYWYIYGFEKVLTKNWLFFDWYRVMVVVLAVVLAVTAGLLVLSLVWR